MSESPTAGDAGNAIEVEEWRCTACGWTEPEFSTDEPPCCPHCEFGYGPNPEKRVRTWPRCTGTNRQGTRCGNFATFPGGKCDKHNDTIGSNRVDEDD